MKTNPWILTALTLILAMEIKIYAQLKHLDHTLLEIQHSFTIITDSPYYDIEIKDYGYDTKAYPQA